MWCTYNLWKLKKKALRYTEEGHVTPVFPVNDESCCCGYWKTLGWPSHGVSSFRSVCGQGQSGGERAEGHRVLQKGETLFTRTFPLFVGRLDRESFFLPKAARQAIDFSCSDQCPAVTLHDPYQRCSNRWPSSDVYLRAHGQRARAALCAGTSNARLHFPPSLQETLTTA